MDALTLTLMMFCFVLGWQVKKMFPQKQFPILDKRVFYQGIDNSGQEWRVIKSREMFHHSYWVQCRWRSKIWHDYKECAVSVKYMRAWSCHETPQEALEYAIKIAKNKVNKQT